MILRLSSPVLEYTVSTGPRKVLQGAWAGGARTDKSGLWRQDWVSALPQIESAYMGTVAVSSVIGPRRQPDHLLQEVIVWCFWQAAQALAWDVGLGRTNLCLVSRGTALAQSPGSAGGKSPRTKQAQGTGFRKSFGTGHARRVCGLAANARWRWQRGMLWRGSR